ncbi:MAG: HepT-like ribonuclease domain-containing protein [bacterium]
MEKSIEAYKQEILTAIKDIEDFSAGFNLPGFIKNVQGYKATVLSLLLIGELMSKMPDSVRKQNSVIPWEQIIGLRHRIAHDYFGLDEDILWKIIHDDIPALRDEIKKLHD